MRYVALMAVLALAVVAPGPNASLAAERCFDTPGITDYITNATFEANGTGYGGLPIFGYPITRDRPEINRDLEQSFVTQWFERNRFEAHPENQAVVALRKVIAGRVETIMIEEEYYTKSPCRYCIISVPLTAA